MILALEILGIWTLVSIPAGILIGRHLKRMSFAAGLHPRSDDLVAAPQLPSRLASVRSPRGPL